MKSLFFVFLGGGLGTILRFLFAKYFNPSMTTSFPLGTFLANIIACLFLGYFFTVLSKTEANATWGLLLMTGFCGGFSTFSTFALENYNLFTQGQPGLALTYTAISVTLGLVAIYVGIKIGYQF